VHDPLARVDRRPTDAARRSHVRGQIVTPATRLSGLRMAASRTPRQR
jgi:hypothetical protein